MSSQLKAYKQANADQAKQVKKIFIAGVGAVGSTLLKQVSENGSRKSLRVLGVCNRKHVLWYDHSQTEYTLEKLLKAPKKDWEGVINKLTSYEKGSVIFVDATGSLETTKIYPQLLDEQIHVVTPSKLANTQSQDDFESLHDLAEKKNVQFLYETNVGAGLPIVNPIKSLIQTGDKIVEISGVVSGTMTYLFSELDNGKSFSESVIKARSLGYAEPDPRDDLSGEDVARKFMILARICGYKLERDDLEVESLIPDQLKDVDATTFLEELYKFDKDWSERVSKAEESGNTLRYTGQLKNGKIKVGISEVSKSSTLGQLTDTNNLIQIKTKRYYDQPLIIQGPGAGKEVTAAGILADILSIA
jgi:aspartokinase/homoserine dehydrogenase 1